MPEYRLSCGNSNTGPVGFVARITAKNRQEALEVVQEALPEYIEVFDGNKRPDGVWLNIYLNPEAVVLADVYPDE